MRAFLEVGHSISSRTRFDVKQEGEQQEEVPSIVFKNGENVVDSTLRLSTSQRGWTIDVDVMNKLCCRDSPYTFSRVTDGKKNVYSVGGFMAKHVDFVQADGESGGGIPDSHLFTLVIVDEKSAFTGGQLVVETSGISTYPYSGELCDVTDFSTDWGHEIRLKSRHHYVAYLLPLNKFHSVEPVLSGTRISYTFKVWGRPNPISLICKKASLVCSVEENEPFSVAGRIREFLEKRLAEYHECIEQRKIPRAEDEEEWQYSMRTSFYWGIEHDGIVKALQSNELNRWSCQLSVIPSVRDEREHYSVYSSWRDYPFEINEEMPDFFDVVDKTKMRVTFENGETCDIPVNKVFNAEASNKIVSVSPMPSVRIDSVEYCIQKMLAVVRYHEEEDRQNFQRAIAPPDDEKMFATNLLASVELLFRGDNGIGGRDQIDVVVLRGVGISEKKLCEFDESVFNILVGAGWPVQVMFGDSDTLREYFHADSYYYSRNRCQLSGRIQDIERDGKLVSIGANTNKTHNRHGEVIYENGIVLDVSSEFNDEGGNDPRVSEGWVMFVIGKKN